MIAITGANGQLGQLVIHSLLQQTDAANIVALVRNPDNAGSLMALGIEVRQADYNQPQTLTAALAGVQQLLLISSSEVGQRVEQHQAVIDAASQAQVSLLVYTSILKADRNPMLLAQEHKITEQRIQQSGLPAVILRNGWYSENYTGNIVAVLNSGSVVGAAADGVFSTASRQDYAAAAAQVLLHPHSHIGQTYELAGDQGFTLAGYAAEIARQTADAVSYRNLEQAEYAALLQQFGLPQGFAAALADAEACAAEGWLADDSQTLSRLLGRPTTPLVDSVRQALS